MPGDNNFAERIKSVYRKEELHAKKLLLKEGALAKKLFYIDRGCCRCWFNNDGLDVTFQFLFEGSFACSFETITSNKVSWYSIETLEPALVYSVSLERFKNAQENNPLARAAYLHYVEQSLINIQKLFVAHIKDNPEKRYRNF